MVFNWAPRDTPRLIELYELPWLASALRQEMKYRPVLMRQDIITHLNIFQSLAFNTDAIRQETHTRTRTRTHGRTHEQVEHNVRYDDIEGTEVDEGAGVVAAVRLPVSMHVRGAERGLHLGVGGGGGGGQITHVNTRKVNRRLRKLRSIPGRVKVDKTQRDVTMQSCMILFQSSPVTMRNSTVMALPAVEKLACL